MHSGLIHCERAPLCSVAAVDGETLLQCKLDLKVNGRVLMAVFCLQQLRVCCCRFCPLFLKEPFIQCDFSVSCFSKATVAGTVNRKYRALLILSFRFNRAGHGDQKATGLKVRGLKKKKSNLFSKYRL